MLITLNQTWLDVCVMETGTLEGLWDFLAANDLSITSLPIVGATYIIPAGITIDQDTLNVLLGYSYAPVVGKQQVATGININKVGIGYWQIESTFKVS
jgi:hypothetical protein